MNNRPEWQVIRDLEENPVELTGEQRLILEMLYPYRDLIVVNEDLGVYELEVAGGRVEAVTLTELLALDLIEPAWKLTQRGEVLVGGLPPLELPPRRVKSRTVRIRGLKIVEVAPCSSD